MTGFYVWVFIFGKLEKKISDVITLKTTIQQEKRYYYKSYKSISVYYDGTSE